MPGSTTSIRRNKIHLILTKGEAHGTPLWDSLLFLYDYDNQYQRRLNKHHGAAMQEASRLVSSAILGLDIRTVVISGVPYVIHPPTIQRIAAAAYYLSSLAGNDAKTMSDVFHAISQVEEAAHALSHLVVGDDSLFETFSNAELDEVVEALSEAVSLISVENFTRLLALSKSVARLTAKPKL